MNEETNYARRIQEIIDSGIYVIQLHPGSIPRRYYIAKRVAMHGAMVYASTGYEDLRISQAIDRMVNLAIDL